jgi:hypothetical protein
MNARTTDLRTSDGMRIYDLDPLAGELWAVAGPDGLDPAAIDPDHLPAGCRWVTDEEWEAAQGTGYTSIRYSADGAICMVWRDGEPLRCPTQRDMDTLPVGADMSDDEVAQLD